MNNIFLILGHKYCRVGFAEVKGSPSTPRPRCKDGLSQSQVGRLLRNHQPQRCHKQVAVTRSMNANMKHSNA